MAPLAFPGDGREMPCWSSCCQQLIGQKRAAKVAISGVPPWAWRPW